MVIVVLFGVGKVLYDVNIGGNAEKYSSLSSIFGLMITGEPTEVISGIWLSAFTRNSQLCINCSVTVQIPLES